MKNLRRLISLLAGLCLTALSLYVYWSEFHYHEDGNLLVNAVLALMLLSGLFLIGKTLRD